MAVIKNYHTIVCLMIYILLMRNKDKQRRGRQRGREIKKIMSDRKEKKKNNVGRTVDKKGWEEINN